MATVEKSGIIKFKDSNGNTTIFYPKSLNDKSVTATGDGTAYTAQVNGISELTTGATFIMIPNKTSSSQSVTLNINGLGAKLLRRRVSTGSATTSAGYSDNWIAADKPIRVTYDGNFWVVDITQPYASDLMGSVPIAKGGTGATDGATGLANLLAAGPTVLSSNQYGDELPTAGSAGRIFFKKV